MRTLFSLQKDKEDFCPSSLMPSQIEPDGATSLKECVQQFMSGVPVHTPQQYYYDFNAALGGIPKIDDIPQVPLFQTIEQVDEYLKSIKNEHHALPSEPPAPPAPPVAPPDPPGPPAPVAPPEPPVAV